MIVGQMAFLTAALFTGAAFYVGAVEQPARLVLDDRAMLSQWKPSYKRATVMQASLVVLSFCLGFAAWIQQDRLGWIAGALLMLANLPVTFRLIMPVNKRLMATDPAEAGPETRALILRWGALHAIRTALGIAAAMAYATAALA
ncbi:DUF1772 domain-containing protein [Methylobacterium gnaphalii]|uniref:DUF1772 domain-containing protein n=1 Tax=Methylobacterium gnaphalii TaxID=1010610 RepID=A0A512JE96_9HYPH|nr:DUF1772 domain-containing protein [Methylobacterium gnaphalii]GEP08261.1 hypothetical protein MGN01_01060 [Methylobacterium gnaphalii]GJD67963.1 hypothetical protein MMMDOFMJ_0881 [Methylobacterium gnaphalii]GLS51108.1 hypothetical protein GCM10007885_39620 [Methylobacterium gnaphalii]